MDKTRPACNHRPVRSKPLPAPAAALLFFAAAALSRLPVLFRSVLDWDESLYFLMASQWRAGHLPYTSIWDNKPVGIYAIFALFQAVFGDQPAAMRIATSLFAGLLAFTVFKITETLTASRPAAWLAGAALILASLSNDGLSANTELFMATFTALAVLAALTPGRGFCVGLLLGAAFMVKYVVLFEAPVILLLLLTREPRLRTAAAALAGGLLPLAACVLLYAHAGKLGLWWDCAVASNFRRVAAPITADALDYALHIELWRWGSLYLAALAVVALAALRRDGTKIFLAAWLLGGALGVISAKSFYDHYFLQLLPVLCVSLGLCFSLLPPRRGLRAGFILAMLALPALAARTALLEAAGPDIPALIAQDLRAAHPASLYVFDTQPILIR